MAVLVQSFKTLSDNNREYVYQELQKFLGKDVTFDRFEATLLGELGFSAREFRIADDPRFAATPFVRAKELKLGVSLWQLLLGRVVINSLTFKDPEFQIITNQEGLLNLSALASRKKELRTFPGFRWASPENTRSPVSFLITKIRIRNGRFDFIDRSVKEPAELQVKNVEMQVNTLDPRGRTKIRFAAAVTEGAGHDVRIEGQLGPLRPDHDWSKQPVDLEMQFDSLQIPLLTRALPILRNKIPPELDVAGPLALQAKLIGTLDRPRITDLTLKGLLFGSSDYNAVLTGTVKPPEGGSWAEAQLKGKLTLDPVNLTQLRKLSFLKKTLPVALVMEGPISLYSQFEGTWENLRIGALIKAEKSQFRYRDWLRKPAGSTADLRARISRQKNGLMLHESVLSLGYSKMTLSGAVEETPEPWLRLSLRSDLSQLAAWGHLVSPLPFYAVGGSVGWDLLLEKNLGLADGEWSIRGRLKLAESELKHKESGRKIDHLNANILFSGRETRVETASFRLGSSHIMMAATVADLNRPIASYLLGSPELNLADLPAFAAGKGYRVKNVTAAGEIQLQNGAPLLRGTVSSSEGTLQQILYRNLRAEVAWSPTGISFKNLSLQALNGTLHSSGFWIAVGEKSQRFELASQIDSVNVQALLTQKFPQLENRFEGQLNFRGQFDATTQKGSAVHEVMRGSGETLIHHGTIRDFNLITLLFLGGRGASAPLKGLSRLPASLAALVNRRDTPFDALQANFTVEQQRIHADNLRLSTPEYTITGAGWVGFDKTTKWNGLLVLSPRVAQQLQREYKPLRYLLDRRGQLSVSFRVEGRFPNVKIRTDNRLLAQTLRRGSSQRAHEPATGGGQGQENKKTKQWLTESLERLLNR